MFEELHNGHFTANGIVEICELNANRAGADHNDPNLVAGPGVIGEVVAFIARSTGR